MIIRFHSAWEKATFNHILKTWYSVFDVFEFSDLKPRIGWKLDGQRLQSDISEDSSLKMQAF